MQQLDDKLAGLAEELQGQDGRRQQFVRAAFVTFNSENERITCTSQCPASEMGGVLCPIRKCCRRTVVGRRCMV